MSATGDPANFKSQGTFSPQTPSLDSLATDANPLDFLPRHLFPPASLTTLRRVSCSSATRFVIRRFIPLWAPHGTIVPDSNSPAVMEQAILQRRGGSIHVINIPPSTGSMTPVTYEAASLARKMTTAAHSFISPVRPAGTRGTTTESEVAVGVLVRHLRTKESWGHRIDPNPFPPHPLLSEVASQSSYRSLASRIGGLGMAAVVKLRTLPMLMIELPGSMTVRTPAPSNTNP